MGIAERGLIWCDICAVVDLLCTLISCIWNYFQYNTRAYRHSELPLKGLTTPAQSGGL